VGEWGKQNRWFAETPNGHQTASQTLTSESIVESRVHAREEELALQLDQLKLKFRDINNEAKDHNALLAQLVLIVCLIDLQ
jgi:hypothetical protein